MIAAGRITDPQVSVLQVDDQASRDAQLPNATEKGSRRSDNPVDQEFGQNIFVFFDGNARPPQPGDMRGSKKLSSGIRAVVHRPSRYGRFGHLQGLQGRQKAGRDQRHIVVGIYVPSQQRLPDHNLVL